jgi:hypothetical protein
MTDWAAVMVTAQGPVPEHAPSQLMNLEPTAGVAVRVITLPPAKFAEQVDPQPMPVGELDTVPLPSLVTERARATPEALKVAVTVVAAFRVTVHVAVPEQGPDQPAKVEPAAGVAVRVTVGPFE